MATVLIAAAIAAASVPPSYAPRRLPDADPAIWVVNDHDTTIYLFGTFHALDGRTEWFNDEVRTAFTASNELVLETIIPEPPAPAAEPAPAFSVPAPQVRSITVTPSASFLASTRIAVSAGRARGMSVDQGADMVLRNAAEAAGKSVEGLESFEYQLGMFRRMPAPGADANAAAKDPRVKAQLALMMSEMQAAWNRGDQGIFAAMLGQMRAKTPDSYRIMFTDRNTSWAQWIAARLQKPGTVFVAVGAGHLAGHDSVQAKLSQLGVRSARIN